jgi:hypothetical protein
VQRNAYRVHTARVLNLALALALAAGLYVVASTHTAPALGDTGAAPTLVQPTPSAEPHWTPALARRFPGFDGRRRLSDRVVVVRVDGRAQAMTFDEAWARGESETRADDVWTVGWQR